MTFRAIDLTGFQPCTLRDQPAPTLTWIDLAALVIDDRYQRGLTGPGRRAIQAIARDWDWTKYQPILIAGTADGRHAVVDGQHRAHAAALAGLDRLPAMIVPMTPLEQANAFAAVNTSRIKLHPTALFKARLAAGDPAACAASEVVRAAGCRLMTYQPSARMRRPGDVFTHALILRMVAAGEGSAVTEGLRAIKARETGADGGDAYGFATRVWDGVVLKIWLPALAVNQQFLTLDLPSIFDAIDWDAEHDRAVAWSRRDGSPVARIMAESVTARLRAALADSRSAAA